MSATVDTAQQVGDTNIQRAAKWLALGSADRRHAVVPQLQSEFHLTALQAVQAIRESRLILARAH
ncbi:hypothetical protein EOB59_03220 [Mesorhizobium sp. M7A.F.Ca.MR.176.00.0.0]|uniref:hypothetical protein n=1 Tax=Mesorhizobium sp. M7A.F.Ca.MR.176.00.0.0 TaxID=2496776 RepID=UPI000FD1A614|nr:hypothetical protein [Mesorhizobium sp. M7A.F.Ca.MR.176.00.0.0]RUU93328.1 hypothetical protein EOB59_03220 [Mesorhizobium sp. M7A.F.Ca.MR.176.00.0.0]